MDENHPVATLGAAELTVDPLARRPERNRILLQVLIRSIAGAFVAGRHDLSWAVVWRSPGAYARFPLDWTPPRRSSGSELSEFSQRAHRTVASRLAPPGFRALARDQRSKPEPLEPSLGGEQPATPPFPTFPFHKATLPQQFGEEFGRTFRQILAAFHMRSTGVPSEPMVEVMSATETENEQPQTQDSGVFRWRFQRSLEMGFERRLADRIAVTEIDLHELERLISWGCPQRTAYRILRP